MDVPALHSWVLLSCGQVALVQRLASARGWDALEVLTVDKCQVR